MTDMNSFFLSINQSFVSKDGLTMSKALALPLGRKSFTRLYQQLAERAKTINVLSYCISNIQNNTIAEVVGNMLMALSSMHENKWKEAYDFELASYNSILAYFKDDTSNWIQPVLIVIANDLRNVASQVSRLITHLHVIYIV